MATALLRIWPGTGTSIARGDLAFTLHLGDPCGGGSRENPCSQTSPLSFGRDPLRDRGPPGRRCRRLRPGSGLAVVRSPRAPACRAATAPARLRASCRPGPGPRGVPRPGARVRPDAGAPHVGQPGGDLHGQLAPGADEGTPPNPSDGDAVRAEARAID